MKIKRNIQDKLEHYLKIFPVVFLTGARQSGKTTLVQGFAKIHGFSYVTLDDLSMLKAVKEDPKGFLKLLKKPCIIDELQRVPELFLAINEFVDKIDQYHYREGMYEVDCVLEQRGGQIIGIEIKSSQSIKSHDFAGLKRLQKVAKTKFVRGIVLYSGSSMIPFGKDMFAVPISALWEI